MIGSIFKDKATAPDNDLMRSALGPAHHRLLQVTDHLATYPQRFTPEWKFYGQKNGWLLKCLIDKRNILFVIPQKGHFDLSFTFGKKAIDEVMKSDVQEAIKHQLATARQFAEGRVIQLPVGSPQDLEDAIKLIDIKINS